MRDGVIAPKRSETIVYNPPHCLGRNRSSDLLLSDQTSRRASSELGSPSCCSSAPSSARAQHQIVHFGGDSGDDNANRRTLKFYHNTVISTRTEKTVLLRLSTPHQSAELWNNAIFTTAAGSTFAIVDEDGQVQVRNCFLKPKWRKCHGELKGQVAATGLIEVEDPQFLNFLPGDLSKSDFHLSPKSPLVNAGSEAPARSLPVEFEPPGPLSPAAARPLTGKPDIGCFEGR